MSAPSSIVARLALTAVVVTAVVAMFLFARGLAAGTPTPTLTVVVLAEPHTPPGEATPVRVLALDERGLVEAPTVHINGVPLVDGAGTMPTSVTQQTPWQVEVRAPARSRRAETLNAEASLAISLVRPSSAAAPVLSAAPWTAALAVPASGPAIFPAAGLVRGDAPGTIFLVEANTASPAEPTVTALAWDARIQGASLPDGRFLAADRRPITVAIEPGPDGVPVVVVERAPSSSPGPVSLSLWIAHGDGPGWVRTAAVREVVHGVPWVVPFVGAQPGDLVGVSARASRSPSSPALTAVWRAGGLNDADLDVIAATIDGVEGDGLRSVVAGTPGLGAALARRLAIAGDPQGFGLDLTVVSPSPSQQAATVRQRRGTALSSARTWFRMAAAANLMCLVAVVVALRRRGPGGPAPDDADADADAAGLTGGSRTAVFGAVGALLCLFGLWWGLDATLGGLLVT